MKTRTTVLILIGCLVTAGHAAADSIEALPVFNVAATTSGIFTCLSYPAPIVGVPCTGSGTSSVTLGSGANTTTLTFHGIDSTFQIVGGTSTPVSLGTIEANSPAGEMFIFPTVTNRHNSQVLTFSLTVRHTSPLEAATTKQISYGPGGQPNLKRQGGIGNRIALPIGPNDPFTYDAIVYSFRSGFPDIRGHGVTDFAARAAAVPEPATVVLLGTGLAGLLASRSRKRRVGPRQ